MSILMKLTLRVYPEDGEFVGVCEELDVATQADTPETAMARLREAVDLHVSALEDAGELHRYLAEHGVKFETSNQTGAARSAVGASQRKTNGHADEADLRSTWDTEQVVATCVLER